MPPPMRYTPACRGSNRSLHVDRSLVSVPQPANGQRSEVDRAPDHASAVETSMLDSNVAQRSTVVRSSPSPAEGRPRTRSSRKLRWLWPDPLGLLLGIARWAPLPSATARAMSPGVHAPTAAPEARHWSARSVRSTRTLGNETTSGLHEEVCHPDRALEDSCLARSSASRPAPRTWARFDRIHSRSQVPACETAATSGDGSVPTFVTERDELSRAQRGGQLGIGWHDARGRRLRSARRQTSDVECVVRGVRRPPGVDFEMHRETPRPTARLLSATVGARREHDEEARNAHRNALQAHRADTETQCRPRSRPCRAAP